MAFENGIWRTYWWLEARIAPGVRYAQVDWEELLFDIVQPGTHWLDVGCGHTLFSEWRAAQETELLRRPTSIVGLDPEFGSLRAHRSISLRIAGDAQYLPFANETFDLVTANMVVEHLPKPEVQFREIARVLKPGGRFAFHTPNADGYPTRMAQMVPDGMRAIAARMLETRPSDDRFSTYYRANTATSIGSIAQDSGFMVEKLHLIRSTAMFWRIAPLAAVELLFLRGLAKPEMARLRPNLIAVLRKQ